MILAWLMLVLPARVLAATDAPPIRDEAYRARYVSQSLPDPVVMKPGETKTIVFRFKNVGTKSWPADGRHPVTAFTSKPRYHASVLRGPNWIDAKQTALIRKTTAPGAVAELALDITAPTKPGRYREEFHLAALDYTWVKNAGFWVEIKVEESSQIITRAPATAPSITTSVAKHLLLSHKQIQAVGGEQVRLIVGFQNLSTSTWPTYRILVNQPGGTQLAGQSTALSFIDESWPNASTALASSQTVPANSITRDTVYFRAPAKVGQYTARFYLQVAGETYEDVFADVSVTVTSDAPTHYQPPSFSALPLPPVTYRLSAEPRIRVGLRKNPEGEIGFVSIEDDYFIFQGDDQIGILPRGQAAVLVSLGDVYFFSSLGIQFHTDRWVRLAPVNNPHATFVLDNFDRRVSWKGPKNFNAYRGVLEYRTTENKTSHYLINELVFEDYVKGIGENSNGAPEEYLKAQSVAQRSYAYYIKEKSDKHDSRYFDVVAHTGDQLYLGVESEKILPRFVAAAEATRGQMVIYNNDVVITPYYGNSDGHTRAWTQVWGGSVKPWLVSVTANYDQGRRMNGHGVGMSQLDAAARAKQEGLNFVDLIKYYYRGVEVERVYE